jgi:hypothetical protein
MAGENWTFWLNMTNFALGIITLLALVVVFGAVGWDFMVRKAKRAHSVEDINLNTLDADLREMLRGSHTLSVPGLGLTMADGGERVDPKSDATDKKSRK